MDELLQEFWRPRFDRIWIELYIADAGEVRRERDARFLEDHDAVVVRERRGAELMHDVLAWAPNLVSLLVEELLVFGEDQNCGSALLHRLLHLGRNRAT